MSKVVIAGIVTAFGAAKRGGYPGTYDEFCADYGKMAELVAEFLNFSAEAETLAEGQQATASYENGVLSLGIPKGDTGNGIQSISLLSTVGQVKTYRITYTNGNHFDFPVADGKGISNTTLNADYTLTITYTDGTTWTSESIRGQVGATPHLTIGTVKTLPPSKSASATITGTDENPVLNLEIPKGDTGEVSQSEFDDLSDDVADLTRQLSDVEEAALALKYTSTKIVPNGTDFDTLTVPGNYRVSSAGNMQTMIHSPIGVAGRIEVLSLTYTNTIFQIVTSAIASPTVWIRSIYNGNAGVWQKLNIIDEVAKTQGTIITAKNYTSYFTSFNDVPPNTIYTIRENTPISDGPAGHANISSVGANGGYAGGILITYEGGKTGNLITRGQIFITYTKTIPQGIIAFRMARYDSESSSIIWGEWGKIGDRTALSATNTIIHSSMVQAGVAPFTDLNDAPNNSMYQLDLDLTAEDMANNPLTGHSAVLYTFNFSYISRHATVQMCFGLNNGMVGYIRYGYLDNVLKWTPWRQITTDIPAAPNQNGTYTLRCTVQNGTKEYAWIAV